MLKTRIVLDEKKIIKESVYCLKELYAYFDSIAEETHMIK